MKARKAIAVETGWTLLTDFWVDLGDIGSGIAGADLLVRVWRCAGRDEFEWELWLEIVLAWDQKATRYWWRLKRGRDKACVVWEH